MHALLDLVARHKRGDAVGITSICCAHPLVLEASLRHAQRHALPLVLMEATCNQVNQEGGYTGMTPADFVGFVHGIAARAGEVSLEAEQPLPARQGFLSPAGHDARSGGIRRFLPRRARSGLQRRVPEDLIEPEPAHPEGGFRQPAQLRRPRKMESHPPDHAGSIALHLLPDAEAVQKRSNPGGKEFSADFVPGKAGLLHQQHFPSLAQGRQRRRQFNARLCGLHRNWP